MLTSKHNQKQNQPTQHQPTGASGCGELHTGAQFQQTEPEPGNQTARSTTMSHGGGGGTEKHGPPPEHPITTKTTMAEVKMMETSLGLTLDDERCKWGAIGTLHVLWKLHGKPTTDAHELAINRVKSNEWLNCDASSGQVPKTLMPLPVSKSHRFTGRREVQRWSRQEAHQELALAACRASQGGSTHGKGHV